MSMLHRFEHNPEVEGIPLGRTRRELAPETSRLIEAMRKLRRLEEETEKLRFLAYHDKLTGLPNLRAFQETFEDLASTAFIKNEKIGLALLDIDGLKFVNDTKSHQEGNNLLIAVADVLKDHSRPGDEVFRLHGDEFAILYPGYEPDTTNGQTQEELDNAISDRYKLPAQEVIKRLGLPLNRVNLSVGVAAANRDETPRDFYRRVDALLYSVKPQREDPRTQPFS